MQNELRYLNLVNKVLDYGNTIQGRNGIIKSLFGQVLDIELEKTRVPIITTRKIYWEGIAGEYATFVQGDTSNVKKFEANGCNYWDTWKDNEQGDLRLDYFKNFKKQVEYVIKALRSSEHNRRLLINFWDENNVLDNKLSLPCCYYALQFYKQGDKLNLLWNQRSVDLMVGLPSDIIIAFLLLNHVAGKTGLEANHIKMVFGDAHIYEEHFGGAKTQLQRTIHPEPTYHMNVQPFITDFVASDFEIIGYKHEEPIKYALKK